MGLGDGGGLSVLSSRTCELNYLIFKLNYKQTKTTQLVGFVAIYPHLKIAMPAFTFLRTILLMGFFTIIHVKQHIGKAIGLILCHIVQTVTKLQVF